MLAVKEMHFCLSPAANNENSRSSSLGMNEYILGVKEKEEKKEKSGDFILQKGVKCGIMR